VAPGKLHLFRELTALTLDCSVIFRKKITGFLLEDEVKFMPKDCVCVCIYNCAEAWLVTAIFEFCIAN
jgi:hypothetical protein